MSSAVLLAYASLKTGVESMDRFGIRARALLYGELGGVDPKVVMAVIWNETKGDSDNYVGDTTSSLGPSIGPMQVSRVTATELGLWNPPSDWDESQAYLLLADDEDWGIQAGIKVLKAKLVSDAGAGSILNAVGLYNGSLSNPRVQTYQAGIQSFLSNHYGTSLT